MWTQVGTSKLYEEEMCFVQVQCYSSKAGAKGGSSVFWPPAANEAEECVCPIKFKAKQSQNQVFSNIQGVSLTATWHA